MDSIHPGFSNGSATSATLDHQIMTPVLISLESRPTSTDPVSLEIPVEKGESDA